MDDRELRAPPGGITAGANGDVDGANGDPTRTRTRTSRDQQPGTGPAGAPGEPGPARQRGMLGRIVRWTFWSGILAGFAAVVVLLVLRFVDPPFTAFTLAHRLGGERVIQQWVPLERISPHLVRAVISSEDAKFCNHFGVDLGEIEAAIERAKGGIPRGASTISMQVVKNLFLWQGKSYVRKAIEIPLTLVMEMIWPKARILEVYLNIAEWGPGVYGAEAAAQFHFEKPASRLSEREAALLAVALPNPSMRDAGDPGPGTQRLADRIQTRMRVVGRNLSCVERAGGAVISR